MYSNQTILVLVILGLWIPTRSLPLTIQPEAIEKLSANKQATNLPVINVIKTADSAEKTNNTTSASLNIKPEVSEKVKEESTDDIIKVDESGNMIIENPKTSNEQDVDTTLKESVNDGVSKSENETLDMNSNSKNSSKSELDVIDVKPKAARPPKVPNSSTSGSLNVLNMDSKPLLSNSQREPKVNESNAKDTSSSQIQESKTDNKAKDEAVLNFDSKSDPRSSNTVSLTTSPAASLDSSYYNDEKDYDDYSPYQYYNEDSDYYDSQGYDYDHDYDYNYNDYGHGYGYRKHHSRKPKNKSYKDDDYNGKYHDDYYNYSDYKYKGNKRGENRSGKGYGHYSKYDEDCDE